MLADSAPRARLWLAVIGAMIGGITLVAQLILTLDLRLAAGFGVASSLVFFFSFFTILTNIAVFLCLASEFPGKPSAIVAFFRRPAIRGAVAAYITVVALVYIFILQHMWDPQGLTKLLDRFLHYVMPAIYLAFWVLFVPKGGMRFAQVWLWMAYPLAYGLYAMLRGALTGLYPYPILDAGHLGYAIALRNLGLIFLLFLGFGFIVVAIDRWLGRPHTASAATS